MAGQNGQAGLLTTFARTRNVLVLPSMAVFLLVFVAPLIYFFVISFWRVRTFRLVPDATLTNYAETFEKHFDSLFFTFEISLIIAVIVTLVAFCFAYAARFKAGRYGMVLLLIALITLFGGYLTKIYVWKTILGQSGIINTALLALGIIDEPITVLLYNPIAVVIAIGHYTLPLAILPIYGALRAIDVLPLRAARDLGSSRWRVIRDIILPQCRVGILVAFTLSFLFAAGDFVTPLLIGGPYTSMIGKLIQLQFGFHVDAAMGSAMAFSVIAICLVIVLLVALILRLTLRVR